MSMLITYIGEYGVLVLNCGKTKFTASPNYLCFQTIDYYKINQCRIQLFCDKWVCLLGIVLQEIVTERVI